MSNITITCKIGDSVSYEARADFPCLFEDVLDSTLDSATISLTRTNEEIYEPLTDIEITMNSKDYEFTRMNWIIEEDYSEESPVGSGTYNHTLSLIEPTKYGEGFICDSLTVTHKGGNIYTDNAQPVTPEET